MRRTKKKSPSAQLRKDAQLGRELRAQLESAVPFHGPHAAVMKLQKDVEAARWETQRMANLAIAFAQTDPSGRPWDSNRSRRMLAWALAQVFCDGRASDGELRGLAPITFDDVRSVTDELSTFRALRTARVDETVRLLTAFFAASVQPATTPTPRPEVQVAPEVPGASPSRRTLTRSRK